MREEMRSHAKLAALAGRQHGVVSRRQLMRLGFSGSAVGRLAEARRVHRVHQGVYRTGHQPLPGQGRCMAAALACGPGAVLSHGSAAWLWGLLGRCPTKPVVTVTGRRARRIGIETHAAALTGAEWGTIEYIPVTSLPRTLLDLAATDTPRRLQQAIERAERLGRLDLIAIDALLALRRGERGSRHLHLALDLYRDPAFMRSRAERLFLALAKEAGLPRPAMNTFVAGHEIDAYWAKERFAVEVDGWDAHRTRAAFESDPLRQENLKLAGIDSIRITARRIEREPKVVGKRLGTLLAQRRRELGDLDR
jgi:predicted transcriptional regulator of viral defense system